MLGLTTFVALAVLSRGAVAVVSRGTPITGYATFYGGPQDGVSPSTPTGGLIAGACGYETLAQSEWPFWNVVGIGPNNPIAYKGNKKGCGYCIRAECTGAACGANAKPVTLLVTDSCESCAPNQLNLNALTFQNNFNSDLGVGRVNITFEQADCTPPGNILAKVVKARPTGGNYIGFAVLAVAGEGTVTSVDIKGQGDATYQRMSNLYGDVWEASLFGNPPLSLRITDIFGRTLNAPNVITNFDLGTFDTGVQFPITLDIPVPAPAPVARTPAPAPTSSRTGSLTASFRPTPAGTFCDRQCFANGLTASQFKKLGTTLSTFACGVSNNDVGSVSGYQLSNSTTTCSVAGGSTVQNSPDYGCLCQSEFQTQGLQPYNGTSCGTACAIQIDGLTGSAVPVDTANTSYVCVPISETSLLNRFGHTVSTAGKTQCLINSGTVATAADQFSCFCLFTSRPAVASSRRLFY